MAETRRRGRPLLGAEPKQNVTLRLDPEILDHYRDQGRGWQIRIGEVLRREVQRERRATARREEKS